MHRARPAPRAAARAGLGGLALAAALLAAGCSRVNLNCAWQATSIVIDGRTQEWSGPWYALADDRIALAVTHDRDFLYLGLAPSDPDAQLQMMHGGVTVWLDPTGGKRRDHGIRYALGRGGSPGPPDSLRGMPRPGSEAMRRATASAPQELEILTEGGKARRRVPLSEAGGIEIRADFSEEQLAYEIRIPLRPDPRSPMGLTLLMDRPLGLGVEVAAAGGGKGGRPGGGGSGPPPGAPGDGGGPSGGNGPRGGGQPPGVGGRGGLSGGASDAIRVWVRLLPAEGPAGP